MNRSLQQTSFTLTFLFCGVVLGACDGDASSSEAQRIGASGIDRARGIASLSATEAAALCDWSLATEGGAGKKTDCGGGRSTVVHTKDECLANTESIRTLASCYGVTVGELEDCSTEEGSAPCVDGPKCKDLNARLETCSGKD
jgi:hypothetical protein